MGLSFLKLPHSMLDPKLKQYKIILFEFDCITSKHLKFALDLILIYVLEFTTNVIHRQHESICFVGFPSLTFLVLLLNPSYSCFSALCFTVCDKLMGAHG